MTKEELSKVLKDKSAVCDLIDAFAENHVSKSGIPKDMGEMIAFTHKMFIDPIFEYAESPIELMFLNSLSIHFAALLPMGFYMKQPLADTSDYIEASYKIWEIICDVYDNLKNETGREPEAEEFIDYLANIAKASNTEDIMSEMALLGRLKCWGVNFVCAVMQGTYPQIKVNHKNIRPDLTIFSPKIKSLRLVIECDGYDYHSDRNKFTTDRVRDRKLKEQGFDVLRFSGSEIYNDPVGSSFELFNCIRRVLHEQKNA